MQQPLTSPYMAYVGHEDSPYDQCTGVDQYNQSKVEDFLQGNDLIEGFKDYLSKQTSLTFDPAGGRAMSAANGYDPDGYDPDGYDSIFGLGRKRQQKKAERKIAKAQEKLAHGDTKAAARKLRKGQSILNKIQEGQAATASAQQQIQDVRSANQSLATNQQLLNNPIQPLSSQPMSEIGSATGGGGMGGAMIEGTSTGTGVESGAASTVPGSDEPTGWLAEEKTLGGVTVTSKKSKGNAIIIIIIAVVLVLGLVYFMGKKKK